MPNFRFESSLGSLLAASAFLVISILLTLEAYNASPNVETQKSYSIVLLTLSIFLVFFYLQVQVPHTKFYKCIQS